MNKISEHLVATSHGTVSLLDWIAGAQQRLLSSFGEREQLAAAMKIAAVDDKSTRDLMLSLLQSAGALRDQLAEARREFDTVHKALIKIMDDPGGGGYYSTNMIKTDRAMSVLRELFPNAVADENNFVLFSTSGVHGSYVTIEDCESELVSLRGGPLPLVTFIIIKPRIVQTCYGNCRPETIDDCTFLKQLRMSSRAVIARLTGATVAPSTAKSTETR